jgi:meso-butanediol dehydrogenase/(S,S)-butanediol dehydrogenase/diacetyl reductase
VTEPPVPDRFAGRAALVTGGASGIGEAIVRRLVAEGASVAVGDIGEAGLDALAREFGDRVATRRCDVTDEVDVAGLVALTLERFGRLDAAFNVAGSLRSRPIMDLELEDWTFTVDVCLQGVFLCMKHEARQMHAQGTPGAIVNVSSLASRVPAFGSAPYCAAKAGAAMLSECGALEWGEEGIRVNTVSPGLIPTPMTAPQLAIPGIQEAYLERIPMRTVGTPDQVAAAALFLGSDEAAYISGVNLFVDGGWATSAYPDLRPFFARLTDRR